jgi:hypothetical protein
MNKKQAKFCKEHGMTEEQFFGKEVIKGSLPLNNIDTVPKGFKPIVEGSISMFHLGKIPIGFAPVAGDSICFTSLKEIPKGFSPVCKELRLDSVVKIHPSFNPACDILVMDELVEYPKGLRLRVGSTIIANKLTKGSENIDIVAGGSVFLCSLQEMNEGCSIIKGYIVGLGKDLKDVENAMNT